ncbi:hypothetical protein [Novosphingobium sp. PP1Y]|uniref:hypothetical protein n=1 Tax=Novosphingobium sp. PP1Y TaxID=702113 RepID=UPI0005A0C427|nr:hypothetical protein [Novosphingobium sp. PP1Y]
MAVTRSRNAAKMLLATSALLTVAACSQEPAEYKADVKDESGGQLIVQDADATGVPVDLPDTPMTPVPPSEAANGAAGQ